MSQLPTAEAVDGLIVLQAPTTVSRSRHDGKHAEGSPALTRFYRLGLRTLLLATCLAPTPAYAQGPSMSDAERKDVLRQLQTLQAEIERLKSKLEAKPAVAALSPKKPPVTDDRAICRLASQEDLYVALQNPKELRGCVPKADGLTEQSGVKRDEKEAGGRLARLAPRLRDLAANVWARSIAQPIADRPNPPPGVSASLDIANKDSRASLTLAKPILLRDREAASAFSPQLLTFSAGVSTPVDKGKSNLIDVRDRKRRGDFDILSGTTLRVGVDFLEFRSIGADESARRMAEFLLKARKACITDTSGASETPATGEFLAAYGVAEKPADKSFYNITPAGPPLPPKHCVGADLVRYILDTKPSVPSYIPEFRRAELAREYQSLFWEDNKNAIPDWGWGASVEFGDTDFPFRQGTLNEDTSDPLKTKLVLDRSAMLADERTVSLDDVKLTGYRAQFVPTLTDLSDVHRRTDVHMAGIMLVGSLAYTKQGQFRPSTTGLTICGPNPSNLPITQCSAVNVDEPVNTEYWTFGAEARLQINNLSVIGPLGFAPKWTYRFEDDRMAFDLPVFFAPGGKGAPTAGLRYRYLTGGKDLLANDEPSSNEVSIFVNTSLDFRKF